MKVAGLLSGGKDSVYALYKALEAGHTPVCLITLKPKRADSYMFHVPNLEWTPLQAEAMQLPHIVWPSSGEKEKELDDLRDAMQEAKNLYGAKGIVSGALASRYQKERVDRLCAELGLESIAPLWHVDGKKYIREIIDAGLEVYIVGVAAQGFDEYWLGRKYDEQTLKDLLRLHAKTPINVHGEGGETESFVTFCPKLFKRRIALVETEKRMENAFTGHLVIKKAGLSPKKL